MNMQKVSKVFTGSITKLAAMQPSHKVGQQFIEKKVDQSSFGAVFNTLLLVQMKLSNI